MNLYYGNQSRCYQTLPNGLQLPRLQQLINEFSDFPNPLK